MRSDEVDHPSATYVLSLVFEGDEKETGDRHELPRDEEQHPIACQRHAGHRRHEQREEKDRGREGAAVRMTSGIAGAVDRCQTAHQVDAEQEERAQRIDPEMQLSERHVPGCLHLSLSTEKKQVPGGHHADEGGKHAGRGAGDERHPVRATQDQHETPPCQMDAERQQERPEHHTPAFTAPPFIWTSNCRIRSTIGVGADLSAKS